MDAIARSLETLINMSPTEKISTKDILRYGNRNRICYAITTGKISPWMLYQSESGKQFLDELDETQVKMIVDYINPELWAVKFKRNPEVVKQVKELLRETGY
jgi:mono/diheme cytochrome c family protein